MGGLGCLFASHLEEGEKLSPLKGNSPSGGNVCEADKRVPVSGGKAGGPKV